MPSINNFHGVMSNVDGNDVPVGASQDQKNVSTIKPGVLTPRKGIQPASFTSSDTLTTSAFNTFQKMCFCKTRLGDVIGVNGVERGFRWDGITDNVEQLGITAPAAAPTVTTVNGTTITDVDNSSGLYKVHSGNALSDGDVVLIGGIVGTGAMPGDLNGKKFTVVNRSSSDFELSGTTFDGSYTSGGFWQPDGKGATKGDYIFSYRYFDDTGVPVYSPVSGDTEVEAETCQTFSWGGLSTTTESRVVGLELWRSTAGVTNTLYRIATLSQSGTITTGTNSSGSLLLTLPKGHGLKAGATITISSFSPYSGDLAITSVTDTTAVTSTSYSSDASSGTWVFKSFADDLDDDTLKLKAGDDVLTVLLDPPYDLTLVARRQVPPPTDRPYVVMFQDRYFYFGIVRYNRGTVSTTANSDTITGASTDWNSDMVGRFIEIDGEKESYEITEFSSATGIKVNKGVEHTASEKTYVIVPKSTKRREMLYSYIDEPESVPENNSIILQENAGDDDEIVGAMPYGPFLYVLAQKHKYSFSYTRDPARDGSIRFKDDRGAFNHYCWDTFEGVAYLMDDSGPYTFSGSESKPIGTPIQNMWRNDGSGSKIDLNKSKNFFVKVDRPKELVYFFVSFVGDSGDYPRRALVYNIRREIFDIMEYPMQVGDASSLDKDGETRMLIGTENDGVHLVDEGTTDVVTTEMTGTVTSASSSGITDSTANFTASGRTNIGASLYIYAGKGKGQRGTISAESATVLTINSSWTTTPDTTSKYVVGAIEWNWKSNSFAFPEEDGRFKREIALEFKPTTNDQSIDVRMYYNNSTTPLVHERSMDIGDAVEIREVNKEDVVVNTKNTFSDLEDSSGRERFRFDGAYTNKSHGDHKISFEVRGYSAAESQEIQGIDIEGVEGKEQ